ncbi:MAG: TonB-dependent receptor plug domain-containing protein [Gemmatimonadota bacterium]
MRSPRHRLAAALIGLALLSATAAEAQEAAGPSPSDTVELKELYVTVYRLLVPEDAVTSEVTVITGEELRDRGIDHVLEALRAVPGAAVVQSGSFGSVTSLFLRGGESDYVQVLVDGVPLNQPGGSFDFGNLTADNIERIEVLRGPASVVYGSDAVTGVVQIFTKRGSGPLSAEAKLRGGTFGTLAVDGTMAGGGETASYSFSLSHYSSDGTLDFNNDYRNTVATGFVRLTPDSRTRADLVLRYSDNEFHFPTDGAGRLVDANQFREEDSALLGLEVSRLFGSRWEGRLHFALSEANANFDDSPDAASDTLGFFAFRSQDDISRQSADASVNYRLSPATVFTAGAEIEEESISSLNESESEFGSSTGRLKADRTNRGFYLQAVALLGERFALTAGARLDDNDAFGTFDTYRLGAAYRFPTRTRVRALFGTGFKEPTFFENFAQGFAVGNPELDPERSRSWEVGLEQPLLDGRISLKGTWFDQRFRDLVQFTFAAPEPGGPNFFNIAEAEASGLEIEALVRPVHGLTVGASYTYLDTEVTDAGFDSGEDAAFVEGDRLLRRPTHTVGFTLGYRLRGYGSAQLGLLHVGSQDDRDFSAFPARRVAVSSHTRVDLAVSLGFLSGGARAAFTPTVRIDNLFDEEYEEARNFPARGRTVLVGARVGIGPGGSAD